MTAAGAGDGAAFGAGAGAFGSVFDGAIAGPSTFFGVGCSTVGGFAGPVLFGAGVGFVAGPGA